MNRKISIEEIEQEDIDMDTLLRYCEYIKRAEAEAEKPVISERTILKIVIITCVTAIIITFGVLSYIAEAFWLYIAIVGALAFIAIWFYMMHISI